MKCVKLEKTFMNLQLDIFYDAKLSSRPFLAFKNGQFSKLPHPLPHPLHPVANRFQKKTILEILATGLATER